MIITTVALIIFAFLNAETSIYLIIFSLVLLGFGSGIFSSPNTHAIMSSVEKKYLGIASATSSMGIVLVIFSIYVGDVQFNPGNYLSYFNVLMLYLTISAVLGVIAIFFSIARN
jgi:hypothetical protein